MKNLFYFALYQSLLFSSCFDSSVECMNQNNSIRRNEGKQVEFSPVPKTSMSMVKSKSWTCPDGKSLDKLANSPQYGATNNSNENLKRERNSKPKAQVKTEYIPSAFKDRKLIEIQPWGGWLDPNFTHPFNIANDKEKSILFYVGRHFKDDTNLKKGIHAEGVSANINSSTVDINQVFWYTWLGPLLNPDILIGSDSKRAQVTLRALAYLLDVVKIYCSRELNEQRTGLPMTSEADALQNKEFLKMVFNKKYRPLNEKGEEGESGEDVLNGLYSLFDSLSEKLKDVNSPSAFLCSSRLVMAWLLRAAMNDFSLNPFPIDNGGIFLFRIYPESRRIKVVVENNDGKLKPRQFTPEELFRFIAPCSFMGSGLLCFVNQVLGVSDQPSQKKVVNYD